MKWGDQQGLLVRQQLFLLFISCRETAQGVKGFEYCTYIMPTILSGWGFPGSITSPTSRDSLLRKLQVHPRRHYDLQYYFIQSP